MPQIEFKVLGAAQMSRNLRLLSVKLKDLSAYHKGAIDIVGQRSDELFASRGSNVEKAPPWPPLAASTERARANRSGYYKKPPKSPSVLRWTGNLQDNRTTEANDRFGSLQFNAPYAKYHQKGGGKLPKRVIIDLSNKTNENIVKLLQKKIQRDIGIFGSQA